MFLACMISGLTCKVDGKKLQVLNLMHEIINNQRMQCAGESYSGTYKQWGQVQSLISCNSIAQPFLQSRASQSCILDNCGKCICHPLLPAPRGCFPGEMAKEVESSRLSFQNIFILILGFNILFGLN